MHRSNIAGRCVLACFCACGGPRTLVLLPRVDSLCRWLRKTLTVCCDHFVCMLAAYSLLCTICSGMAWRHSAASCSTWLQQLVTARPVMEFPACSSRAMKRPASSSQLPASRRERAMPGPPDEQDDKGHRSRWAQLVTKQAQTNAITIAADCSGWCSEVLAARAVSKLPMRQAFMSDTCKSVRTQCAW